MGPFSAGSTAPGILGAPSAALTDSADEPTFPREPQWSMRPITMVDANEAPPSFEAALAELEEIVTTMESGRLPLQESLAAYKRGALLLHYCQSALKDAQLQVEVLEKGVVKAFEPSSAGAIAPDNES
jgi:exodeoxyribonuclease VII small subunit